MQLIKINLIPRKKSIEMPKLPIGSIIGVLLLCVLGYYLWVIDKEARQAEIDQLQNDLTKLQAEKQKKIAGKQQELEELRRTIASFQQKIDLVKGLIGSGDILTWTEIMQDFSDITSPVSIWITSFNADESNKLTIAGVAKKDINEIGSFMEKLKEHKNYSQIFLQSVVKGSKFDTVIYTFNLTCRVEKGIIGGF